MKFRLMANVFLSSTCDDLDQLGYRAKALQAINQRQLTPESMEFWETRPQPSVDKCLEKVRNIGLLVLVVAFRYGWIPPGQKAKEKRSITWMEVEEAGRKGIPILPYPGPAYVYDVTPDGQRFLLTQPSKRCRES